MITSTQAREYLDQALGVSVPGFMLDAAVAKVAAAETAMIAAYGDADIVLMQCMAVAIIACLGAPKRTSSQHAASGASRSFKFSEDDITALRRSLAALDTQNILMDVVGPDPVQPPAFVYVV
jgi:hypothetical protein